MYRTLVKFFFIGVFKANFLKLGLYEGDFIVEAVYVISLLAIEDHIKRGPFIGGGSAEGGGAYLG